MNFNTKYIIFALFFSFANNFCMQQALALKDYYEPQQVVKELLPSLKLPTNSEIYTRAKLRNSDKKSYSPADVFDLLKKAKVKFNLSVNLDFLLPKCAICCEDLTEETVASSSERFICAGHSERFCKEECLNNPILDKCPICRSTKIENCPPEELLFQAAQLGRTDLIKKAIRENMSVNATTSYDATPLMLAAEMGHLPVVKLLIKKGADVNKVAQGFHNTTALHQACQQGHADIAALLITNGADVNAEKANGITPLISAAQNGHLETVKILINNGANVKAVAQGLNNITALHQACQQGYADIAELLITNGADVNAEKTNGNTPLMQASEMGRLPVVELLIKKGANVNKIAQGFQNATALQQACQNGHANIAELLITNSADVNAEKANGFTPLISAAQNGHLTTVQSLINNGANVNAAAQGFHNTTALHQACQNGYTDIAALLITNGADVNAVRTDGITPLMLAQVNGFNDICEMIKTYKQMRIQNSCAIL